MLIREVLEDSGYPTDFLSKENLALLQQAFGPMFRGVDEEHPRISQRPDCVIQVDMASVKHQTFSESALKSHGAVFFADTPESGFTKEEANLWEQYCKFKRQADEFGEDGLSEDARTISRCLHKVKDPSRFKTPWNILYTSYEPERKFVELLIEHADLFSSYIKSPDRGFYSFPYSFKPSHTGRTHVANENFNPDFFLHLKDSTTILVVELKGEEDRDKNRSAAKYRDGCKHIRMLNDKLKGMERPWQYLFYFLSPDDFTLFFQAIRDRKYEGWTSGLMQQLGR